MLRANNLRSKSSFNLDQYSGTATLPVKTTASSKQFGSRWTLAQAESTELLTKKQEDLHNTYYNNMVMYINNKQGDNESSMSSGLKSKKELFKSRESLYSTMLPVKEAKDEDREDCGACGQCDSCCDSCCCSFWSWVLALLFAVFGFLGGVIVGAVIQRNGVLHEMGIVLPQGDGQYYGDYGPGEHFGPQFEEVDSVMNRQGPQSGPGQGPGFSGRTRIILPGEEGDPNRVIIPGQQNYNNNPYNNANLNSNNMNLNSNNMYQQNRGSMYQPDNSLYQNHNRDNSPFSNNNNPYSTNNNNPFNAINNNNQMFSPKNNLRNRQGGGGQNRRTMLQSSRSLGQAGGPGLLPMGDPRCMYQFGQINTTASPGSCSLCSASRLINVTGAGYADCDGLYSISSLASIWDNKRMVYERVAGGWRPTDKRYIYWNAHFFGENFYGWSIGDKQSLSESGPFHSQGRIGAGNQPWQGSWRGNVSVDLVTCNPGMAAIRDIGYWGNMGGGTWESGRGRVRINPKNLEELQILRQREQETVRNQQQQRLNRNNERF